MSKVIHVTLVARSVLPLLAHTEPADVTELNEHVIRANLEKINRGDVEGAAADWAADAQNFGRPVGRAGVQYALEDILATFPDYHMEIEDIVAAGDVVVTRCRVTGTHRGVRKLVANGGALLGIEPTGKRHEIAHIYWYTLRDGKIVQQWATRDDAVMLRQLGLN